MKLEEAAIILESGWPGSDRLSAPTTPESLARLHPALRDDMEALGPWTREEIAWPERDRVASWRSAADFSGPLLLVEECPSTMDLAWEARRAGILPDFGAVAAVRQAGGRGQMRRPWFSPAGNLHVSWVWPSPPQELQSLAPLLAGFALRDALARLPGESGTRLHIKWPNDLLQNGVKVAGVLVEERPREAAGLVVGIGINVVAAPETEGMREGAATPAGRLELPGEPGPLRLWRDLASRGGEVVRLALARNGPAALAARIEEVLAWKGRRVLVREGAGGECEARMVGLASDGGLRILREGVETVLYSGSVFPL